MCDRRLLFGGKECFDLEQRKLVPSEISTTIAHYTGENKPLEASEIDAVEGSPTSA